MSTTIDSVRNLYRLKFSEAQAIREELFTDEIPVISALTIADLTPSERAYVIRKLSDIAGVGTNE